MTKIKIDYHGIFMQISNEMRILDWHTLKCPQLVHFQVPHDTANDWDRYAQNTE